jgi:hypothetical protein
LTCAAKIGWETRSKCRDMPSELGQLNKNRCQHQSGVHRRPHSFLPPSTLFTLRLPSASMKFSTPALLSFVSLPALASAHDLARHLQHKRQNSATPSPPAASSTTSYTTFPSISISLLSTNPTAIPTASIVAGAATQVTHAIDKPATPGSTPTYIPSAPALPNGKSFSSPKTGFHV